MTTQERKEIEETFVSVNLSFEPPKYDRKSLLMALLKDQKKLNDQKREGFKEKNRK